MVFSIAMLFFSCKDGYKRVGDEAQKKIYPQGIAEDFVLTYTETPEKVSSEDTGASKRIFPDLEIKVLPISLSAKIISTELGLVSFNDFNKLSITVCSLLSYLILVNLSSCK